jgi:zinc transporter, ZIP family
MNILYAFLITLFAGLSTGLGGLLAFTKMANKKSFLAFSLGLSAGVMLYVSFIEIFPKAFESLAEVYSENTAYLITTLSFFGGMALIGLIDYLVPDYVNPHTLPDINGVPQEVDEVEQERSSLLRMGLFTAAAIAIHNFPEGLATFIAASESLTLGISIGAAIAIHNIPEGIAVAMPIYHATGSKAKALWYSLLSGLAEPLGAIVGIFLLQAFTGDFFFGILFSGVGGIMVYISLDELLPSAEKYGKHHISIIGLMVGMAIMAASLVLFL